MSAEDFRAKLMEELQRGSAAASSTTEDSARTRGLEGDATKDWKSCPYPPVAIEHGGACVAGWLKRHSFVFGCEHPMSCMNSIFDDCFRHT